MSNLTRLVLARSGVSTAIIRSITPTVSIPIRSCGWARDWKPGPPPTNEQERRLAAQKYNLIPEDYDVNSADQGLGDYPKLPPVGMDARDPYEDFDYYYYRRNYGEPLHHDFDAFTAERHDPNEKYRVSPRNMVLSFLGFIGGFFLLFGLGTYFDLRIIQPVKPKQFPGPGKVHYTFEPAELDD